MKIYEISQDENNAYDTYDSAIVCAENEEEAKKINPDDYYPWDEETKHFIGEQKTTNMNQKM